MDALFAFPTTFEQIPTVRYNVAVVILAADVVVLVYLWYVNLTYCYTLVWYSLNLIIYKDYNERHYLYSLC